MLRGAAWCTAVAVGIGGCSSDPDCGARAVAALDVDGTHGLVEIHVGLAAGRSSSAGLSYRSVEDGVERALPGLIARRSAAGAVDPGGSEVRLLSPACEAVQLTLGWDTTEVIESLGRAVELEVIVRPEGGEAAATRVVIDNRDLDCRPGAMRCAETVVQLCTASRTWTAIVTCSGDTPVCDARAGGCMGCTESGCSSECTDGDVRCHGTGEVTCAGGRWPETPRACRADERCVPALRRCAACDPTVFSTRCDEAGTAVVSCTAEGILASSACRDGDRCESGACGGCEAGGVEVAEWRKVETRGAPPGRSRFGAVYDANVGQLLVFGGLDPADLTRTTGELWGLDRSSAWRRLDGAGPPSARYNPMLEYDERRHRVALMGGVSGHAAPNTIFYRDVFAWDGARARWTTLCATCGPAASRPGLAYDTDRSSFLLLGGRSADGTVTSDALLDWSGEGERFVARARAPAGLEGAAVAYDEHRGRLVVFGGHDGVRFSATTWEYEPPPVDTWTRAAAPSPNGPRRRSEALLVYDPERRVTVLHGGRDDQLPLSDTWVWNGYCWRDVTGTSAPPASPSPRGDYDREARRVVVIPSLDRVSAPLEVWAW